MAQQTINNSTDLISEGFTKTNSNFTELYGWVDQDVTSGASPTFDNDNFTATTDKNYVTDAEAIVIGNTSGTNTGDQTSIVGITGTKAQFDTSVTDGNIMYIGDAPTAHAASHLVGGSDTVFPADPNADKFLKWDDTGGQLVWDDAGGGAVDSVFTRTGAVVAADGDYSQSLITGLKTSDSPQFTALNIGAATDTTVTRTGAGDIAVEGNAIYRAGGIDVPVADGGTGRSSHTAYAVLCGGTTSTAAQQSIAGVGTSGQVLTSNGAGALPTMEDAAGGASQLSDLSDVVSATNTDKFALMANGTTGYVGRALVEADISDLGTTIALVADKLDVFAATTSAELQTVISDETGTGLLVFGTQPTFTTNLTVPRVMGGTATTQDLYLQTTSGVAQAGADMHFVTGNDGSIEAMTIDHEGTITVLSAIVGGVTGNAGTVSTITGLAPDTATTQATQASITSAANLATVGTIGTGTWDATDVGVAHGGTGKSSWTQYLIPYADTTTSFSQIPIGTDGQVLTSGGAGVAPGFEDAAGGGTWTLIAEAAITSGTTIIDATSIASGYDIIKIRVGTWDNSNNNVRMQINNESGGTDYNNQTFKAAATTLTGAQSDGSYIDLSVGTVSSNDGFVGTITMTRDATNDLWYIKSSGATSYLSEIRDCGARWSNSGTTELNRIHIFGTASFNSGFAVIEGRIVT